MLYIKVNVDDAKEIFKKALKMTALWTNFVIVRGGEHARGKMKTFTYKKWHRVVIKQCSIMDLENIEEYISTDGYRAAKKACTED
jgi:NADH-quinone oxidoreductase subunit F